MITVGECGGDFEQACPGEAIPYLIGFMVGLPVAIIANLIGGRFTLTSMFPASGVGALWAGFQAPPGEKVFPYVFGGAFILFGLLTLVRLLPRKRPRIGSGRSEFVLETKMGNSDSPQARRLFERAAAGQPPRPAAGIEVPEQQPPADPLDRLAKLHQLKLSGALTEEEFQAQKSKLLGE